MPLSEQQVWIFGWTWLCLVVGYAIGGGFRKSSAKT